MAVNKKTFGFKLFCFLIVLLLVFVLVFVVYSSNDDSTDASDVSVGEVSLLNPLSLKSSVLDSKGASIITSEGDVEEITASDLDVLTPYDFVVEDGYELRENGEVVLR